MACKKITKTNGSESELINTLETITGNEFKAEAAYAYFDVPEDGTSAFIEEFGNYIEAYEKGDPSFKDRVDENGEPKLFYNDTAKKYYFINKAKEEVFYPLVKRGLRSLFDYKQTERIISRLALNYFKGSKLNFDNIRFEEGEKLPNLKQFVIKEIETKIKQLQTEGVKGKFMAKNLTKSLDYVDEYVNKIDNFYKQINIKRVDNDDVVDLQTQSEEGKDPAFNKSSFEHDSKESLSNNIKLRLSLLEDRDVLDPVWNEPTFVSFSDVYSTLINNISNQVALEGEDIFDIQRSLISKIAHKKPYLKQLVDYFNSPRFTESDKNQFAQAFNLHHNNFLVSEIKKLKVTKEGEEIPEKHTKHVVKEVSESGSKASIVASEWGNNFKQNFLTETNQFKEGTLEVLSSIYKELEELKSKFSKEYSDNEFASYVDNYVDITRRLGIELTEVGIHNHLDDNGTKAFDIEHQKSKLSTTVSQTLKAVETASKSFKKPSEEFNNPFETQNVFKNLAKAESFFLSEGSDASIWTSGKNKWLFSYPSYLSTRILQWQKKPELLKQWYEKSAYNRGSLLGEYLLGLDIKGLDEFGNEIEYSGGLEAERERVSTERLKKLKLGIFNTFQEVKGDSVSSSDISFNDYFNDHVNKVLTNSYVRTTTPADKGTDFQIKTGLFVDTTAVRGGRITINDKTLDIFFKYFNSEFNRMKEASKEVDASKNNPENLKVHYHYKDGSDPYSKNGNAFNSQYFLELSSSFNSTDPVANRIKAQLYNIDGSIKHTSDLSTNESLKNEIKNYISEKLRTGVENTISTFLMQEMIELDSNGQMKNILINKDTFATYMENNANNVNDATFSAASDFYINGLIQNIEYSKLFTGDVAFYKNLTDYKKRIPATYTDGLQLRIKKGQENFTIASVNSINRQSPAFDKLVEMLGEEGAKPYKKINSTDGQAWITPARWKFLYEGLGKWTPAHNSVYKKMTSDENEVYTKDELKIMAQPLKGVYFYQNGKTPTFLKYSQAVLTKGLVKGSELEKIYDAMIDQGVDEMITIDGIKVGSPTPTTVHDKNGNVLDNIKFNKVSLSNYGWKLQQDLPIKTFKQIDVGSQIQKNIFAGLKFNTKLAGFVLDGKETNGQKIIDEISRTVKSLIDKGIEDLGKEFGVGRDGKIKNVKGLYNALIKELEQRGGSQNMVDALKKQTALYGMPQSMDKIINIYSSIMNDRLIKIKTNGGAFIQMANFGLSKDDTKDQKVIWSPALENGDTTFEPQLYLDEDTGRTRVRPGGILISGSFIAKHIPNYKDYTPLQLFGGKDAEGNVVEPIIDKRILENLIGYRIPNQGLSSNDALQIVGILPEENGDTVVAYTGITTKTGSDFDIDKMFIMMPNFTKPEGVDKLVYTEYVPGLMNAKQSKEALQNRLIEAYKAVLTHKKVIKDVMQPIDIAFIEEDIKDLMPIDTTGFMFHFDSYNDIKLRYEFIAGKMGVGQEANALVDMNRLGSLSLNKYYIGWGHSQRREDTKETIFDEEFSENLSNEDMNYYVEEMRGFYKKQGKEFNEKSFRKSITNIPIGSSLTAILNAFVDIAKDPYITRGNWTTSTTNTGNLMLRAGVNPLYVTAFLAQPIIKQYVEYQASLESITSKNSGDTKNKFRRNLVLESLKNEKIEGLNKPLDLVYQKLVRSTTSGLGNLVTEKGLGIIKKEIGKEATNEDAQKVLDFLKEKHNELFNAKKIEITDTSKYDLKYFRDQIKGKTDGSFQIAVYEKFLELQTLSKAVKENVDVSKLDTSGMGKNISSLYGVFNLRQHILDKEKTDKVGVLNGFESKFNKTTLNHYYNSMKEMMRIVQANPKLFPQGQQDVQNMFNEVSYDLYNMPLSDVDLMTDLEKNYYTYVMSNFSPFNLSEEETKELIDNLPAEFIKLKRSSKGKYLILDELELKRDGKLKTVGLNNRKKSASFEEKFTDSWRDLMIDNPTFAENLIKYSFLTSGFRMTSTQFYSYIPHEYMLQEGINHFIPRFTAQSKTDFLDKFYLNNTHNFKYVPKVFNSDLVSDDFASGFIVKEQGAARYYVQRDNGSIYKLQGYNERNQGVYVRVMPLGKKYKGGILVEFGDKKTNLPEKVNPNYIDTLDFPVVRDRNHFHLDFELERIEDREEDVDVETTTEGLKEFTSEPEIDTTSVPLGYELIQDPETGKIDVISEEDGLLTEEAVETREEAIAIANAHKASKEETVPPGHSAYQIMPNEDGTFDVLHHEDGIVLEYAETLKEAEDYIKLQESGKKPKEEKTTTSITSMSEITNHSGGAKGYDAEWDLIGAEYGMVNNKHYLLPSDGNVSDQRLLAKGVTPVDATADVGLVAETGPAKGEAQVAVTNAERTMGRIESHHVTRNTKKIRNYAQVKNADAVFAVGSLIPKGAEITISVGRVSKKALVPQVNGGTSVAVQLGIEMNKPTYVFNQVANEAYETGWYVWDNKAKDFVKTETPTLTKNFAGIGTSSSTTELGTQAIRDVYEKTQAVISGTTILPREEQQKIQEEVDKKIKEIVPVSPHPIEIGRFVKYKGTTYMVTQLNDNGTVQIYNPLLEGPNAKISPSPSSLTALKDKAKIVNHQGTDYIVTPNNAIISTVTNKIMNWSEDHKDRRAILELAENGILAKPTVEVKIEARNDPSAESSEFKPANKQQEIAIEKIQDFIKNGDPDSIFVLEGKAGTGKTTIVQEAIADAVKDGKRILIAALSHKAKLVLAKKLNKRFPGRTSSGSIAGILGMKMDQETGEFTDAYGEDAKIAQNDVIIIDEASMVNEDALELMMTAKRKGSKLIFLGDRGQLPPIRKTNSDDISIVFESEHKASLTERVRQGEESPILPFADFYWDNSELKKAVADPVPDSALKNIASSKGNLLFTQEIGSIFNDIIDTFKRGILEKDPNVIKIVTYRNATRQAYNKSIREELFGRDAPQLLPSDIIMFQNNYKADIRTEFSNSDEFSIETVNKRQIRGYKVFEVGVKQDPDLDRLSYFPVLDNEDKTRFDKDVAELFNKAAAMPKGRARTEAYKEAWALKNLFAEIDYAYAITSHKSQGSTYENVIVDVKDINSVGATTAKSKSRSIYTALTRASKTVVVVTNRVATGEANIQKALAGVNESKLTSDEQQRLDEIKKYCK